jgi:hypothetical protein
VKVRKILNSESTGDKKMGGVIQAAEQVLAPALNNIVGPIINQVAGSLGGQLGQGVQGLLQGFEQAFLGGFQGPGSMPGQTGFPQLPSPFPQPPYADNPFGPFGGQTQGTGGITPSDVQKVGGNIDTMEKNAMAVLSDPNASKADIAKAQQTMEMASQMFAMLSKMLEQQSEMSKNSIQAVR